MTDPICTVIDLSLRLSARHIETALNEADKLGLISPEQLRSALDKLAPRPGIAVLRSILDRTTFVLTDSELECRFLPLARAAGLPLPETQRRVNDFKALLLARAGDRRRDRRPALPPDTGSAGPGSAP